MKYLKVIALLFISAAMIFWSCNDNNNDNSNGTTKLEVRLTDAPASYDAVNIDIQEIKINASDSENSGWQTLNVLKPGVYNLLDFRNGVDTLLASQEVPAGKISQIRFVLGSNNTVVKDGVSHLLATPLAQTSGLKLNLHTELVAGVTYRLWIDFDAARSIVEKGNGGYSLKPVLRAYTEATGGTIRGNVKPAEALPIVWAVLGQDSVMAQPDIAGDFLIPGLTPSASWKIGFDANAATGYVDRVITNISVTAGKVTALDSVVLEK